MSFSLRQVARRAGGGDDIIRKSEISAAQPTIGRGSDCDIQIPDLSLDLHHATMRQSGRGRVVIEGVGRATFIVNGARVSRAELAVANAPKLIFGNFALTLSAGSGQDEIVVNVTADDSAVKGKSGEHKDPFSLKAILFSQRRAAWFTGLLILFICLVLPVTAFILANNGAKIPLAGSDKQWSSGPLSAGHHFLENDCQSCHQQAFVAVRDTACLTCHQPGLNKTATTQLNEKLRAQGSIFLPRIATDHASADRLARAKPSQPISARGFLELLGDTFQHPDRNCTGCHTEHVGKAVTASTPSEPAPVSPDQITRIACEGCHTSLKQKLADTTLADVPDWGHHPDFRPLIAVAASTSPAKRIALSSRPTEQSGLKFTHELHLLKNGGVARMSKALGNGTDITCANCHRPDASAQGFLPVEMTRDCAGCHSLDFARSNGVTRTLPHGDVEKVVSTLKAFFETDASRLGADLPRMRPGSANQIPALPANNRFEATVRSVFSRGGVCLTCHTVTPPKEPASLAFQVAPVHLTNRYLPSGSFNHNIPEHKQDAAGKPTCVSCHGAENSTRAEDVLLPKIAECAACHGKNKAETVTAAGAECAMCHGYHNPGTPVTWRREITAKLP